MQGFGYFLELVRRVFWPTTRGADSVSLLVPLMVAAVAKFSGVKVSENATVDILAYVGAFTLLLFVVRLCFTAPYGMWKEQVGEVGRLKLELSKPEQLELERIAKIRAKARINIAERLRRMHWWAFEDVSTERAEQGITNEYKLIVSLSGRAGLGQAFENAAGAFARMCMEIVKEKHKPGEGPSEFALLEAMTDHLHGRLTAEALALRLPPDTEPETQP